MTRGVAVFGAIRMQQPFVQPFANLFVRLVGVLTPKLSESHLDAGIGQVQGREETLRAGFVAEIGHGIVEARGSEIHAKVSREGLSGQRIKSQAPGTMRVLAGGESQLPRTDDGWRIFPRCALGREP